METPQVIICKRRIVQRMAGREPALRPVVQWIVIEARTASQHEDAGLYMGLSNECWYMINGDAPEARQVNWSGGLTSFAI